MALVKRLDMGAATIQPGPGANVTAIPIIYNLAPGTYNSSVFVIASSGVAISNSTSLVFPLANQ